MTNIARGICCILLALAVYLPIVGRIYRRTLVTNAEIAAAERSLVAPHSVFPEPAERESYLVGCLLAPPLLFGLIWALRWLESWSFTASWQRRAALWSGVIVVALVYARRAFHGWQFPLQQAALAGGLMLALVISSRESRSVPPRWWRIPQIGALVVWLGWLYWSLTSNDILPVSLHVLYREPLWAVPVLLAAWPAMAWLDRGARSTRWLGGLAIGLALALGAAASWIGEHSHYTLGSNHFSAAFEPVAQVQLGKDLLVDYDSQYGLYPDLLAPLFAVVGLSVLSYSIFFGCLTAASFGLLGWILSQIVSRRSIALLGTLALVFNAWLLSLLFCHARHSDYFDPYFQYWPIRLLFPVSAVALTWAYHRSRSRGLCGLAHVWLSIGLLWNLDSGLVAWAAWLGTLGFDALYEPDWIARGRAIVRHGLAAIAAAAGVAISYALVKHACFGVWPVWSHLFDFQRLFYLTGFYMMPMHLKGVWPLVILLYLAGILYAAIALERGERGPRPALVLMVSALGLGLFSYYQGRSHDLCLILCWWPAVFLLPIYWDLLLPKLGESPQVSWLATGLRASIAVVLISSAASVCVELPQAARQTAEQLAETFQGSSPFADDARLLRELVPRQDDLLVLSRSAALIHLDAGIPSLAPAGLTQMLWIAKYQTVVQTLNGSRRAWVFIDRDYDTQFFLSPQQNYGSHLMMQAIAANLQKVAESSHGCLYEFHAERLPPSAAGVPDRGGVVR